MRQGLKKKLRVWTERGLLTPQQAAAIETFEQIQPSRSWALYGIVGIGVTALVTGVISLIAANWDIVPPSMKLMTYFVMQAGVGAAFLKHEAREGVRREALLVVFATLLLAGIGMVAQIFHLRGDGWQALLFWLCMTLPAASIASSRLLPHLWVVTGLGTNAIWFFARTDHLTEMAAAQLLAANVAAYFVVAALSQLRIRNSALPVHLRSAAVLWSHLLIFLGGSLAGSLLLAFATDSGSTRTKLVGSFSPVVAWDWVAFAIYAASRLLEPDPKARHWRLVAALGFALLHVTLPLVGIWVGDAGSAALFFAAWGCLAAAAVSAGHKRAFDVLSFIIAGRFVVIYFEVFGSLLSTGIGLIVSGVLILATTFVWYKYRGVLGDKLGKAS